MTCLILEYAWPARLLTRRNLLLLSIAPLLAVASILTNDSHHLSFIGFRFGASITPIYGPLSP
jgi:hypothetical protein